MDKKYMCNGNLYKLATQLKMKQVESSNFGITHLITKPERVAKHKIL